MRKDKAGSGLGEQTDFAPELGWTIAFAFDDRGNGGVIRMDDFALTELFALGQALRLFGDLPMRVARGLQVASQALALRLAQVGVLVQERLCLLGPERNGTAQLQQVLCGLAHQRDQDFALAPALAAKATHDLVQGLVEFLSGVLQSRGRERALLADPLDEVQHFFWALYNVVASVTR